jgi:pyrroline-5-carboxylate reductase
MLKLGFIGTGKIASSVIIGISNSKIKYKQIIISPRNKKIALSLKKKFKKIIISKTNQEIVDKSDWVFLSVTPTVGEKIIKDLKFKKIKKLLVSYPQ